MRLLHDVFICHASEDKDDFVRPLAERLRGHHLDVWYDEFALTIGDSLRETIDRGLAHCRYGVVVVSPAFFQKPWAQRELSGLIARQMAERREIILPIWHQIDRDEVLRHSPPLADVFAANSSLGINSVVNYLVKRLRPEESPLVVARDFLIDKGLNPPSITDEWWLDLVEIKESQLRFPDLNFGRRWIFPLPFPQADHGRERGLNIAWTALQMDWAFDGETRNLCQLTRPEQIHDFLRKWPGLFECGRINSGVLAMYAPQITIPGFDDGFADVFDPLLAADRDDAYQSPGYGGAPMTNDGKTPPCGELIAWRHSTFGNYTDEELAYSFVHAHDENYSRQLFNGFECLTWLLSDESKWMPTTLWHHLIKGMRTNAALWFNDAVNAADAFPKALMNHPRNTFRLTPTIRLDILELCNVALAKLRIQESPGEIAERFIANDFITGFYDQEDKRRSMRSKQHEAP